MAGYCAESLLIFSRLVGDQPTAALKDLIDTTIVGLKDDGVFELGDCLYVRGVHTSELACQNWIKNAHNSTLVNSPTFTQKQGITGAVAKYINNNYIPNSQAVNMSLGSETIVTMHKVTSTTGTYLLGAQKTSAPISVNILAYSNAGNEVMYLNSDGGANNNMSFGANEYGGYTRSGTNVQAYKDGVASGAVDVVNHSAFGMVNFNIYELCGNVGGNAGNYVVDLLQSFSFYGGLLNPTEVFALYTRIKYFYDNVGGTF